MVIITLISKLTYFIQITSVNYLILYKMWENYIAAERIKRNAYNNFFINSYFRRTYDQQEIDMVEEQNAALCAYEFKWRQDKAKIPVAFAKAYPDASFSVIHSKSYPRFIT